MISFDVHKLIRQLLPTFLRAPVRVAWLKALLSPFAAMWAVYVGWRADKVYEAHTTCQTVSMEAYLNRLFDAERKGIRIVDVSVQAELVYVELRGEGYRLYIDGEEGTVVPLMGEELGSAKDGFMVRVPYELEAALPEIRGVVNNIRAVGIGFETELYYAAWVLDTGRWDDAGEWEDEAEWRDK